MTQFFDFKRLKRLITIYAVVQVFLAALLIYMAVNFQANLTAEGRPQRFLHSVVVTLVLQLVLFYPLSRFAAKEAEREVESCASALSEEDVKSLRSKRIVGDSIKTAIFIFFITFIYKAPRDSFILSIIFFTFILTFLSYFQCYNFTAKRLMRQKM